MLIIQSDFQLSVINDQLQQYFFVWRNFTILETRKHSLSIAVVEVVVIIAVVAISKEKKINKILRRYILLQYPNKITIPCKECKS